MNAQRLQKSDLVRLFEGGSLAGLADWQLLDRFSATRDGQAFEALVSRHGPMVMGACRRMLSNASDAEDAFQATFLVLLRRASSLGQSDSLGPWLHGVAVKVSQQARGSAVRRGRRERPGLFVDVPAPDSISEDPELRQILDQEIDRLPSRYRLPVVLCYLEGQTHEQAARSLQWPLGTVKGRLARARSLLESRLTRRGVACATALTALAAGSTAQAAASGPLVQVLCRTAAEVGPKTVLASVVPTSIARLVQGVLSTMIVQKLRLIAVAAAVSGLFLTGAGVLARQQGKEAPKHEKPSEAGFDQASSGGATETPPGTEVKSAQAEPVPTRKTDDAKELYKRAIQDARRAFLAADSKYTGGGGALDRVYLASRLLLEGERNAATSLPDKLKALEDHLERMRSLARRHQQTGNSDDTDSANARAYVAEAESLLAQARVTKQPPSSNVASTGGPGRDPKSQAILAKLEEPVSMSFANETPLEDVLKYIKQATSEPNSPGIPIYVDPVGLQEAEKTITSTIQLDLEGVPLRRTLQLALNQLDLIYYVDDGILVITSRESEQMRLPPTSVEPSPFMQKQDKAERGEMSLEEMKKFVEELKVRKEMMNAITELQTINETGMRGFPDSAKSHQTEALMKEIRELLGQIRAEREKAAKAR
jgi:RNA polymerase sigma factor (sigma-70 family)